MKKIRLGQLLKVLLLVFLLLIWSLDLDLSAQENNTDWPKLIQQLEDEQNKQPNDIQIKDSLANAYNNYGLIFANEKQWSQAESYLQKAMATNPSSLAIKKNLSNVYFAHGYDLYENPTTQNYNSYSHTEAKQLANQALALNNKNTNAYILLGDIEYINQDMRKAQAAWQKAAELNPDNQDVKNRLAKITREAETENNMSEKYNAFFIIKVAPELENVQGFDINQALNSARIAVANDFNYKQNYKIPVIVYSSQQYQDTLTDAPQWSEGAYDGKLRIIMSKNQKLFKQINSTIIHEYTHAVIADLTNGNIPLWLNEGIAKYEEYRHGVAPLINVLALAYNTDTILPWDKINESFTASNKSEVILAYQQSFSFVYYLVERYGMSKLVALLNELGKNPDFPVVVQQIYQLPIEKLHSNWRLWLTNHIGTWAEAPARAL